MLEAGCVYLVPLIEQLKLRSTIAGFANPKSSTGPPRRVHPADRRPPGRASMRSRKAMPGPLFAEICPRTFSIKVRYGSRLNQIRFRRRVGQQLDAGEQPGPCAATGACARSIPMSVWSRAMPRSATDSISASASHQFRRRVWSAIARAATPAWSTSMRSAPTRPTNIGRRCSSARIAASCSTRTSSTSWPRRRACRCRRPMSPRWRRSIR